MKTAHIILYICIIIITIVVFLFQYNSNVYVKSSIDGREYKVKNNSLSQQSADALAQINGRLVKLIDVVQKSDNPPEYTQRLNKYSPHSLSENIWDIDTTYTTNKGYSMTFCLSTREGDEKIYDINTLMYVAIHELAHVASVSFGHTEEFLLNFKSLLRYAIKAELYAYVDYNTRPVEYCGLNITDSIL
jgi:hypothetical protein